MPAGGAASQASGAGALARHRRQNFGFGVAAS